MQALEVLIVQMLYLLPNPKNYYLYSEPIILFACETSHAPPNSILRSSIFPINHNYCKLMHQVWSRDNSGESIAHLFHEVCRMGLQREKMFVSQQRCAWRVWP